MEKHIESHRNMDARVLSLDLVHIFSGLTPICLTRISTPTNERFKFYFDPSPPNNSKFRDSEYSELCWKPETSPQNIHFFGDLEPNLVTPRLNHDSATAKHLPNPMTRRRSERHFKCPQGWRSMARWHGRAASGQRGMVKS